MSTWLQTLHIDGGVLVAFAVFFIIVEIVKGIGTLWGFIAPRFLGIKTTIYNKKEIEKLTVENNKMIREYMESQDKINEKVNNRLDNIENMFTKLSNNVISVKLDQSKEIVTDFASGVASGRNYTKEQYVNVMNVYHEYIKYRNDLIDSGQINNEDETDNDIIEISYRIIKTNFEKNLMSSGFIGHEFENKA